MRAYIVWKIGHGAKTLASIHRSEKSAKRHEFDIKMSDTRLVVEIEAVPVDINFFVSFE